jgi:hypothetical protein
MNSIARALNNIALSLQAIANEMRKNKEVSVVKAVTSNPNYYNTTSKVVTYQENLENDNILITKKEYKALLDIHKALTDKGSHPIHHDHVMRELQTKWPVLFKALNDFMLSRSYISQKIQEDNKKFNTHIKHSHERSIWRGKNG